MKITNLLARVFQSSPRPAPAQRLRVRLQVEGLEERRVLSGSQVAQPALPQLAQAQSQSACQGHWVYMVGYHQKNCAWHTQRFNSPQQANKFAKSMSCQGYTVKPVTRMWVQTPSSPILAPTFHS